MSYADPTTPPATTWPAAREVPALGSLPLRTDDNIQGNVLAGFNKDQQVLLFLRFPSAEVSQTFLRWLLPHIARNDQVVGFNERFSRARKASGTDPADMVAVWTNLSLTADGVDQLAPDALTTLKTQTVDAGVQLWLDGAASSAVLGQVGDSDPSNAPDQWLFGRGSDAVHALVCIAADRGQDLALEVARHRERASRLGYEVVFEQPGTTLPGTAAGHEHFGFKDGISQPGVRGFDQPSSDPTRADQVQGKLGTDLISPGTFLLGYQRDEEADSPAPRVPKWMWDGSFLVTRRLAQDVAGFWSNVQTAHASLPDGPFETDPGIGISSPDALAARLVGRWRSGTPTDHAPAADNRSSQDPARDNDFSFSDDPNGERTPAVAHIRKVYPRGGAEKADPKLSEEDTMAHRIIRRGIPYGSPFAPTSGRGEGVDAERGLLFQCYQSSLADGFVFIQKKWVNEPTFTDPDTGNDAVIGLESDITIRGAGAKAKAHFLQWVHTRGALFSFTPSITALKALAAGSGLEDA